MAIPLSNRGGGVWIELAATGEFIFASNYESQFDSDSKDDQKELNDIDWRKIKITKAGLTQLNGS